MGRALASFCLLACFAAGAVAAAPQGDEVLRQPTFARVVDAQGRPLAGATVVFAGGLPHLGPELQDADAQVVQADERGRARARLRADACYVVWAMGPADAAGRRLRSALRGWFAAGALLELRCAEAVAPRRVAIDGLPAWAAHGALRCIATSPVPGLEQELPVVDGAVALPDWPEVALTMRLPDGQPLWQWSNIGPEVVLPPPRTVRVRTVDERGQPLAGAEVQQRIGRRQVWRVDGFAGVPAFDLRRLGRTGPDGELAATVPYPSEPWREPGDEDLLLFAAMDGRPAVAGGVHDGSLYANDTKADEPRGEVLEFRLRPAQPLAGQCGPVPAGTVAQLVAVCKLHFDANGYQHDARTFTTPVAADGAFQFTDVPAELHSSRLVLRSPRGAEPLPILPAQAGRELPAELTGPRAGALAAATGELSLRVLDPSGGPARGLVVYMVPADTGRVLLRDNLLRVPLDTSGRATVALLAGRWAVQVVADQGQAAELIDVAAGSVARELQLQPLAELRVRLLGADGEPVVGARVLVRRTQTRGSGEVLASLQQQFAMVARDSLWSQLATGPDGRLAIPYLAAPGLTMSIALVFAGGRTEDFALQPQDGELVLRPK